MKHGSVVEFYLVAYKLRSYSYRAGLSALLSLFD